MPVAELPTTQQLLARKNAGRILASLSLSKTLSIVASLLTVPSLDANTLRLEALVHMVLSGATGSETPSRGTLMALLNRELGRSPCASREDPVEDVFVANVMTQKGNRLLLTGLWESIEFYIQRLYNIVCTLPTDEQTTLLLRRVEALLRLCTEICNRRNLRRFDVGEGNPGGTILLPSGRQLAELQHSVEFTCQQLANLGITEEDISPFVFQTEDTCELAEAAIEKSPLHARPIVIVGQMYVVALPSAVGNAIREHILRWMIDRGYERSLDDHLAGEYLELLADTPFLGAIPPQEAFALTRTDKGQIVIEVMQQIDRGRDCHLVALVAGVAAYDAGFTQLDSAVINERIGAAIERARRDPQFLGGLTLIVNCGLGMTTVSAIPQRQRDWWVDFIPAADYVNLMNADWAKIPLVWRMIEQLRIFEERRLEIVNPNGLLNLFAWWQDNDYFLLPSRSDIERIPDVLSIPTDNVLSLRRRLKRSNDIHLANLPDGTSRIIQRKDVDTYFKDDNLRPLYASGLDARKGSLLALWEGKAQAWLQLTAKSGFIERDTVFRVWDAATNWLARVAPALELNGGLSEGQNFQFAFDLDRTAGAAESIAEGNPATLFQYSIQSPNSVRIALDDQFFIQSRNPENLAERTLVRTMLQAAFEAAGKATAAERLESILDAIVPTSDMRYFHSFFAHSFREMLHGISLPRALFVTEADSALAKTGLTWSMTDETGVRRIQSVEDAVSLLHRVVDRLLDRLCVGLRRLDRQQVILLCLRTIESVDISKQQWQHSALAVMSTHAENANARDTIAEQLSKHKAATIALRLIVEIALQESPTRGGSLPGVMDITAFMTDALLLFQIGGASDAIHRKVMPPDLLLPANGDVLFGTEFGEIVSRYGADFQGLEVDSHAEHYESHFREPRVVPTVVGHFAPQFLEAFRSEFGVSVDELRAFRDAVENEALRREEAVFVAAFGDLIEICRGFPIDEKAIHAVLESFSLANRGRFENIPQGFKKTDLYPWRFRRRLSLISRPLVQLDNDPSPTYMISPGLLGESITLAVSRSFEAEIQPSDVRSTEMKRWLADESSRKAHELVVEVAGVFSSVGFEVLIEKRLSELLGEKSDDKFGDVDVLAWKPNSKRVIAIECKNLQLAKTATEIAEQLSRFAGMVDRNGERDDLLKHIERCDALRARASALTKNIKSLGAKPVLLCAVCFSRSVAIKYVQSRFPRVRFWTLDEIRRDSGLFERWSA